MTNKKFKKISKVGINVIDLKEFILNGVKPRIKVKRAKLTTQKIPTYVFTSCLNNRKEIRIIGLKAESYKEAKEKFKKIF